MSSSTFPHTKNNNPSILATRDPNTASPPPPSALKGEKKQEQQQQQQQQQQLEEGLEVVSDPNIRESESREDGAKVQSMEFHRRVLRERLEEEKSQNKYVSPSDTIMSPCTAKLSAYKNKHFMKAKPQSLFAKMEAAKVAKGGENEGKGEGA